MSFRGEIAKYLLKTMGPDVWNEFWVGFAQQVVEKERKFKAQPGAGQLKAAEVKSWAHARLAPLLPDFAETVIFSWLDGILVIVVTKSNEIIGQDWVSGVESIEAYFAQILEPLLDVDLDHDGKIGSGAAKVVLVLGLVGSFLFGAPEACHAQRRPLVEHYRPEAAGPPPADAPRPRSDDVRSPAPGGVSSVGALPITVGTWTGYRSHGRGTGTWDAGVAVTLKRPGTPWQPSLLVGKGGGGFGLAWKRLGAMAFWDGSLSGGIYGRAFDW